MCSRCLLSRKYYFYVGAFSYSTNCLQTSSNYKTSHNRVKRPTRKIWAKTAILQAIANAAPNSLLNKQREFFDQPEFFPVYKKQESDVLEARSGGVESLKNVLCRIPQSFETGYFESTHPGWRTREDSSSFSQEEKSDDEKPTDRLLELLKDRDATSIANCYIELVGEGIDIPSAIVEKVFACVGYNLKKSKNLTKPESNQISKWQSELNMLDAMFEVTENPSQFLYCVLIRTHSAAGNFKSAYEWFQKLESENCYPDLKTLNSILNAGIGNAESQKLYSDILFKMSSGSVMPSSRTFSGYIVNQGTHRNPEQLVEKWAKCLREMKALGITPDMHILNAMYSMATAQRDLDLIYSVIEMSKTLVFEPNQNDADNLFFNSCLRFGFKIGDITMVKSLYRLATEGMYSAFKKMPLLEQSFFTIYLRCLVKMDTIENVAQAIYELVPLHLKVTQSVAFELLKAAEKHSCPSFLPVIYTYVEANKIVFEKSISRWLLSTSRLLKKADQKTVVQLKNIVSYLSDVISDDTSSIANPPILSLLLELMSRMNDSKGVRRFLKNTKKFPTSTFSQHALDECHLMTVRLKDFSVRRNLEQLSHEKKFTE